MIQSNTERIVAEFCFYEVALVIKAYHMEFPDPYCFRLLRSTKIAHKCFLIDARRMTHQPPKALPCHLNDIGNSAKLLTS